MPNVTRGISTLQHLGVAEGSGRQIHTSAPTSTVAVRGIIDDLHAGGVVVIAGPRDIGTSAVARVVGQRILDESSAGPDHGTFFDLRSRSSGRPDDARAAAGRILSAFGLDEPADATPPVSLVDDEATTSFTDN